MNRQAMLQKNTQVRRQFNRDCLSLKTRIVQLQARNELLSMHLEELLAHRQHLLNRMSDWRDKARSAAGR